jgi:hypothetical protein
MGICHGWAPASYRVARPLKAVEVVAKDGRTKVPFYPHDVKGLVTLLWANAPVDTVGGGGRCNEKNPKMDSNGRVIDQVCFDQNPAAWHFIMVNLLGDRKESFVLDATFDYQVWNQPAYSYEIRYFNPETGASDVPRAAATIPLAQYTKDKFRSYRARAAVSVVGVAMDVSYVLESNASSQLHDDPVHDYRRTARYLYDLELDAAGRVIGGEWYTNVHPDFVWNPVFGARPYTIGDRQIDRIDPQSGWSGDRSVPDSWRPGAVSASRQGMPLAKVVETLVALSRL